MEGPSTASTLIHAATLVTAGPILLSLCLPLSSLPFVFALSVPLALLSSILAAAQSDSKRALAYSTASHISLLFSHILLMPPSHLLTHAIFKALSFLSVALLLHSTADSSRDTRLFGPSSPSAIWLLLLPASS